jgi:integrase
VERVCLQHGITPWTPSRLRHTRLNEIRDAYGPDHVQAVASHKHISMADVYTSAARRKAEEVAIASG